jgi:hypothetical protein
VAATGGKAQWLTSTPTSRFGGTRLAPAAARGLSDDVVLERTPSPDLVARPRTVEDQAEGERMSFEVARYGASYWLTPDGMVQDRPAETLEQAAARLRVARATRRDGVTRAEFVRKLLAECDREDAR